MTRVGTPTFRLPTVCSLTIRPGHPYSWSRPHPHPHPHTLTPILSASKAAVRSFARRWSVDLKDRKIRVNVISPGPIETPAAKKLGEGPNGDQWEASVKAYSVMSVLGRIGQPDEIAKPAVFLASDDSAYITGIELFVDGGIAQIWNWSFFSYIISFCDYLAIKYKTSFS